MPCINPQAKGLKLVCAQVARESMIATRSLHVLKSQLASVFEHMLVAKFVAHAAAIRSGTLLLKSKKAFSLLNAVRIS